VKILQLLIRVALSVVFLYSGVVKAGASEQFAVGLAPFTILPPEWTAGFAVGLAWTEIAAGVLILIPRTRRAGAVLIVALCCLFIGVLVWALANGIIVACGCFGGDEAPSAAKMVMAVVRDILLLLAAVVVLELHRPAEN